MNERATLVVLWTVAVIALGTAGIAGTVTDAEPDQVERMPLREEATW